MGRLVVTRHGSKGPRISPRRSGIDNPIVCHLQLKRSPCQAERHRGHLSGQAYGQFSSTVHDTRRTGHQRSRTVGQVDIGWPMMMSVEGSDLRSCCERLPTVNVGLILAS